MDNPRTLARVLGISAERGGGLGDDSGDSKKAFSFARARRCGGGGGLRHEVRCGEACCGAEMRCTDFKASNDCDVCAPAILHRMEGDYDNYTNQCTGVPTTRLAWVVEVLSATRQCGIDLVPRRRSHN